MTKEEYDERKDKLTATYQREKSNLDREYVLSHNPVEVGDIVGDYQLIIVENIHVAWFDIYPCCRYEGPILTKKLIPYKNKRGHYVLQARMKTHIKKADIEAKGLL